MGKSSKIEVIRSDDDGYIESVDSLTLANCAVLFGSGRQVPSDKIDHTVGLRLLKTKGDKVSVVQNIPSVFENKPTFT